VTIDLGTGDGRLPYTLARREPGRLFIGLDANAAGVRERSGRAFRAGLANVLYARAAVEDLPAELSGVADRVTVVLPWGSLLGAVARPSASLLHGVRALCQPGATLTVVLGPDPVRDRSELLRLGLRPFLAPLDARQVASQLTAGYRAAGFALARVRALGADQLVRWPSTWAKRIAHGRPRSLFEVEARAVTHCSNLP
jgi:16S rRNA (adenine(1408)-N(1))-methyltransferase